MTNRMSLLEKFDSIEVDSGARISEEDRRICEAHQAAYLQAGNFYRRILGELSAAIEEQKNFFPFLETERKKNVYLNGDKVSISSLESLLKIRHSHFIGNIVSHFNQKYHTSIDDGNIKEHILPEEPSYYHNNLAEVEEYHRKVTDLDLKYQDVLDEIFLQLGGASFADRSMDELKENCWKASHICWDGRERFEIKGDTIRFQYGCSYKSYLSNPYWTVRDGDFISVFVALGHFESGEIGTYASLFSPLFSTWDLFSDRYTFPWCKSVKGIRLFKNGRLDVKFASPLLAQQFADEYMRQRLDCGA